MIDARCMRCGNRGADLCENCRLALDEEQEAQAEPQDKRGRHLQEQANQLMAKVKMVEGERDAALLQVSSTARALGQMEARAEAAEGLLSHLAPYMTQEVTPVASDDVDEIRGRNARLQAGLCGRGTKTNDVLVAYFQDTPRLLARVDELERENERLANLLKDLQHAPWCQA